MFTGIIEAIGEIYQIKPIENSTMHGMHLSIKAGSLDFGDVKIGDSIAINGICLTVTALHASHFIVDVSQETLNCTYGLDHAGAAVNLEKAMRLSDRLGGHLVSGHVDATGTVVKFEPAGECFQLTIQAPQPVLPYLACKGSIAVNGVSLTINAIEGDRFSINLIPHTLANTTLHKLSPGMRVNLETDMLARYVARLLNIQYLKDNSHENQCH
ncbi:MAG: riboflavin synthase [Nitrosomonas sp.]|nr:MAG: riboflavin synthase [Nitrosomonas sp.]